MKFVEGKVSWKEEWHRVIFSDEQKFNNFRVDGK